LLPFTEYKVNCATQAPGGTLLSVPGLDFKTAGFTGPIVAEAIGSGGFVVRAKVNVNSNWLRCCVYNEGAPVPFAPTLYDCQGALGRSNLVTNTRIDLLHTLTLAGLTQNTAFSVYCGIGYLSSTVIGAVSNNITVTTTAITEQPVQTGTKFFDLAFVQLTNNATEIVRCVAVTPGAQPTAEQVFAGQDETGKDVLGKSALASISKGVSSRIVVSNLMQGMTYDGYCATKSLALTNRFALSTDKAEFTEQIAQQEAATNTTFAVRFKVNQAGRARCVVVNPGEMPTAEQIMNGESGKGQSAINAPGAISINTDSPVIFKFTALLPGRPYHAFCATASNLRSGPLYFETAGGLPAPIVVKFTVPHIEVQQFARTAGLLRCVAVRPGQEPTPFEILRGLAGPGVQAAFAPVPFIALANSLNTVIFEGVQERTTYVIYCADQSGIRSAGATVLVDPGRECHEKLSCAACAIAKCVWNQDTMTANAPGVCSELCSKRFCSPAGPKDEKNPFRDMTEYTCADFQCIYGEFSQWSGCTDTCSGGTRTRQRTLSGAVLQGGCDTVQVAEETCKNSPCKNPTINEIPVQIFKQTGGFFGGTSMRMVTLTGITSGGDLNQGLHVSATSNDPDMVRNPRVDYVSPATDAALTFSVSDSRIGETTVTVTVVDTGASSTGPMFYSVSFIVRVEAPAQDCVVGFGEFSTCTRSCDGGERSRVERVLTQPSYDGIACPGNFQMEVESCNSAPCDSFCVVKWTDWSACDVTCGQGMRNRIELILSPPGSCQRFPREESEPCFVTDCPQDCVTKWGEWGGCSAICDGGVQSRSMVVSMPTKGTGRPCPSYMPEESRECNLMQCAFFNTPTPSSGMTGGMNGGMTGGITGGMTGGMTGVMTTPSRPTVPAPSRPASRPEQSSCLDRCGDYTPGICSCDDQCERNGDCCADVVAACDAPLVLVGTCAGNCGYPARSGNCFCDATCSDTDDCCDDFATQCSSMKKGGSCRGRCEGTTTTTTFTSTMTGGGSQVAIATAAKETTAATPNSGFTFDGSTGNIEWDGTKFVWMPLDKSGATTTRREYDAEAYDPFARFRSLVEQNGGVDPGARSGQKSGFGISKKLDLGIDKESAVNESAEAEAEAGAGISKTLDLEVAEEGAIPVDEVATSRQFVEQCACDASCVKYKDCCDDYSTECTRTAPATTVPASSNLGRRSFINPAIPFIIG
jgi:hypothetical protein